MLKRKPALECGHCGGAMIDRFEEMTCVMCGRASYHVCENCLRTEEEKPSASQKGKKKATAAA